MRVFILGLAILVGCESVETQPRPLYDSVVLAAASETPGTWQPSTTVTGDLAAALPRYLDGSQDQRSQEIHTLDRYVCVYRGVTFAGARAIHAEFLCKDALEDFGPRFSDEWKTGEIGVDGGGACFFAVTYLPDAREFVALHINASR